MLIFRAWSVHEFTSWSKTGPVWHWVSEAVRLAWR